MRPIAPDRYLRLDAIVDRTGLSRATIYRQIGSGNFPRQHKLAKRCCGWRESEINAWMRDPSGFSARGARQDAPAQ